MAKTTTLESVKTKMQELKEARAAQYETINAMKATYTAQINAAAQEMKQATTELNVDAYDTARQAKRKAQAGLDMYKAREADLANQEIISEQESDKIIDSLLEYEETIAADFRQAITEPIRQLRQILDNYKREVANTEKTIHEWEQDIHANYISRNGMSRVDQITGERTNRSETPLPVHRLPYLGCPEAQKLEAYLKKENEVL